MASATRKSLASRAGAAARKVVSRGSAAAVKSGKAAAKKAPAERSTAKKAAAKATAPKKAAAKATAPKTGAKKAAPKKAAPKKAVAKKAAATRAAPKKTAIKKTATTKTATTKTASATTTPVNKRPAKKAPVKKAVAKSTATSQASAPRAATAAKLVVLEAEDPWTKAELKEVKAHLADDVKRLTGELAEVEEDLAGMIENSGEGAGNDQADVGSASFERDQEMVIVNNARDMLEQSQHALERISDSTYGKCEICGNAIGKNRLMAFPRATLCLTCKQREERR